MAKIIHEKYEDGVLVERVIEAGGSRPLRAWLYTLRPVRKGEELVWDYRLQVPCRSEAYAAWACACGRDACRGTMADPDLFEEVAAAPSRE